MITFQKGNLFELDEKYVLAHCISQDLKMGKGISVDMRLKFELGNKFKRIKNIEVGKAILVDNKVFNLITRKTIWDKQKYDVLISAIEDMKRQCFENNIKYLGLPKLGCGDDGLEWSKVKNILENIFKESELDVQVRILEK